MSGDVKDSLEKGAEQDLDLQTEVEGPVEKLGTEGLSGMPELTQQERERRQLLKSGGKSGIPYEFGSLELFEGDWEAPGEEPLASALDVAYTTPLGDKPDGSTVAPDTPAEAKKEEKSAADVAAEFKKKGEDELREAHKNLKVTTDGSAPRAIEYNEKFTVPAEKTPLELAEQLLGASATREQKELYAQNILYANGDFTDDINKTKYPAGLVIKMPGQTAYGGITRKDGGTIVTDWTDGSSMRVTSDGSGSASYRTADGWHVEVRWDPRDKNGSMVERSKGNDMVTTDHSGTAVEKHWDEKKEEWIIKRMTHTDDKGRDFVVDYTADGEPNKVTVTNPDKSTQELTAGKDGDFVSADGKTGMDNWFNVYTRAAESDGAVTKSFENGYKVKLNAKGNVLHEEGKDAWGRAYSYDYKAGEKTPHTARITPREGAPPIEFKRVGDKGFEYQADYLDKDGKKIGYIELGGDGRIIYNNDKDKTQCTELKDGTALERKERADGSVTVTMSKAGESQVTEYSKKGAKLTETSITSDGRKLTKTFGSQGKTVDKVTIENPDGSKTEMSWDKKAEQFRGERKDANGKVLEKVLLLEDKLVYTDATTGAVRAEKYAKRTEDSLIPSFVPGEYDQGRGYFRYKNDDGSITIESLAPGRVLKLKPDGSIEGTTVRGEKSTITVNGEVTIEHADGSGIRLKLDRTIDRWGRLDSDRAAKEQMSPVEENYFKAHPDINKQDFAEIHRRFGGDQKKLDAFYIELEKIESAQNLTEDEKSILRDSLMHHVAFPEEIYQGRTPSCNVSVIERDMAMKSPDKYVATVVRAVSEGFITTADGTRVPLDPVNLKMPDSSGRNLASRIFQTTAIQAEFYPRKEFRNSEDGVGRLYPVPYNVSDKPLTFQGMTMPHIAEVRYKLTGEEKGIVRVATVDDLVAAYDANGGPPMTIFIDATKPPFGGGGPVGKGSDLNHVVTITRIDKGPPVKVYVANQWGLQYDHSSQATAVDGKALLDNMRPRVKVSGKIISEPAMVLSAGDHKKGYEVKKGKILERKSLRSAIAKGLERIPAES